MQTKWLSIILLIASAASAYAEPRVEGVTPGTGPVGTQIQITGSGFSAAQGTSTIKVNGVSATVVSWSDTVIAATVPNTASGAITVTVGGVSSNTNLFFSVTSPTITAVVPNTGPLGTQVQISGSGFGATKGSSSFIYFSNTVASVVSWSDSQIVAVVPTGSFPIAMPVQVRVNGVLSNSDVVFTSTNPMISGISPGEGAPGTQVDIYGSGFGATQGSNKVDFHMGTASIVSWGDTHIVATVPAAAISGTVTATVGGVLSNNNISFNVPPPHITSVNPAMGQAGTQFTVVGSGFHPTQGSSYVQINNTNATVVSWSDTQIVAKAPLTSSGFVKVVVNAVASNSDMYFQMPSPRINGIEPNVGPVGTTVNVSGSGFGASQGTSTLSFNSIGALTPAQIVSWSDSNIVATVPPAATSGTVQVKVAGIVSNNSTFTVPAPVVTNVTPTSGVVGTQLTISGSGFQATQRPSYTFPYVNGVTAPVVSWSDTQIVATVPATKTGPIKVTVNAVNSNQNLWFSLPNPVIANTSPTAGPGGTIVQINGSGFGEIQGSSLVRFSSGLSYVTATVNSWSDSQIVVTQPSVASSGYMKVTAGGVDSNSVYYTATSVAITAVSPLAGPAGAAVTVTGSGFGSSQGTSAIYFNNTAASVTSWSDTQIVASVSAGTTTGPVKVFKSGTGYSNTDFTFTVTGVLVDSAVPNGGPAGTQVQVNGRGFGATQGTSTVKFNGASGTVVSWSDTQIVATVPTSATTGSVKVTVGSSTSNDGVIFTVPAPHIDSISPSQGITGSQVTLTGSGFQPTRGSSNVQINWINAAVVSWSDTQVVVSARTESCCAAPITTGPVRVIVNGVSSNTNLVFTMPNPIISSVSPSAGTVGTQVQINGSGFGATQGTASLKFNGTLATNIVSWSDSQIVASIPLGTTTGPITITEGGIVSNNDLYFSVLPPHIDSISPNSGPVGTQVTVTGSGFEPTRRSGSQVQFNGANAAIVSWSDTQIVASVPCCPVSGPVSTYINGVRSNQDLLFTMPAPYVSSISPATGPVTTQVQISGTGFGATQGNGTVTINSNSVTNIVGWSDTLITVVVPTYATSGAVKVTAGGIASNTDVSFNIPPPHIDSIEPPSGPVGTQVTITGSGFQDTKTSFNYIQFNGVTAPVISWSDTQIVATVPATTTGSVKVAANNVSSNTNVIFTLPSPKVISLVPDNGRTGTQVQINGSGFGATKGSSNVYFNVNYPATVVSWSDSQIVALSPVVTSGPVRVNVSGVDSNRTIYFNVPPPRIDSISPTAAGVGNPITLTGVGFEASRGGSNIKFGSLNASIVSWSDTRVVASVPGGATPGLILATVNSINSNAVSFGMPTQSVSSVTPTSGPVGTQITVTGSGFGADQGTNFLSVNSVPADSIVSWSDTQIVANVPVAAASGPVRVNIAGVDSNATVSFTVPPPVITSLSPVGGGVGTSMTIYGTGFQANQRDSVVKINGVEATVSAWADTQITATVPVGAESGPVTVAVNSIVSNSDKRYIVAHPVITSISPQWAGPGGDIWIYGSGFGSNEPFTVKVNGVAATCCVYGAGDTIKQFTVQDTMTSGPVTITYYGVESNGVQFTRLDQ